MTKCIPLELILVRFDLKKVELTPEQKIEYNKANAERFSWKGTKSEKILKTEPLTEKEFYINMLNRELRWEYFFKSTQECKEKGHIERISSVTNHTVYCVCKRCHLGYTRGMSIEESKSWYNFMHKPMDIQF